MDRDNSRRIQNELDKSVFNKALVKVILKA